MNSTLKRTSVVTLGFATAGLFWLVTGSRGNRLHSVAYRVTIASRFATQLSQPCNTTNGSAAGSGFSICSPNRLQRGSVAEGHGRQAAIWIHGRLLKLGTLGGYSAVTFDVNSCGVAVGQSQTPSGAWKPFLWQQGMMQNLDPAHTGAGCAEAINSKGAVAGYSETAVGQTRAWCYIDGKMIRLGTLAGESSAAYGISSNGTIVGEADTAAGHHHAFAARIQPGQPISLQDLNSLGATSGDMVLTRATAIDESGRIQCIAWRGEAEFVVHLTPAPQPQVKRGWLRRLFHSCG